MNDAPDTPMAIDAFLEWESRQPNRFEFDGIRPVERLAESAAHDVIQGNLLQILRTRLADGPYQVFGGDLRIHVGPAIRIPDAVVVRTPRPYDPDTLAGPVAVFEILSPATSRSDCISKHYEYRATLSIQHYVMLEQSIIGSSFFSRVMGNWNPDYPLGPKAELALPGIGLTVKLGDLYEGVTFDAKS